MYRTFLRCLMGAAMLIAAFGLATTGCKGKSGSGDKKAAAKNEKKKGRVGSCNRIKIDSLCQQFSEDNFIAGEKHLKQFCDVGAGVFKLEPCPKDNRIGSCVTAEGTKIYYTSGATKHKAAELQKSCTEGIHKGKWLQGK